MNPQENLKTYVHLLAKKHGGLEGLRHEIEKNTRMLSTGPRAGLELAAAPDATRGAAIGALESLSMNRDVTSEQAYYLEAIIKADIRPVIDIIDGKYTSEHPLWKHLSSDAGIRGRLEACFSSIGRLELPGNPQLPYGGTAFVVGNGLVMTNRHVAEIFATGLGITALNFRPGLRAGVDFLREQSRPTGPIFRVTRIVMIHPYWDMALLAVDGIGSRQWLPLSLQDAREIQGQIAVVGYPAFDPRNPADVQQNLFNGRYGVKRLQPGELQGAMQTGSFGKFVNAATHDCSTLGGNSGSAVIDLATGRVVGLHFGGLYQAQNYAVPTAALAQDQRVVDAGVDFDGVPHPGPTGWENWWERAAGGEQTAGAGGPPIQDPPGTGCPAADAGGSAVHFDVPLRITISLGSDRGGMPVLSAITPGENVGTEGVPFHDSDYSTRTGYDPDFLRAHSGPAITVPMPTATNTDVLAVTNTGSHELKYENFSIQMHAGRRLALVTASNVTKEPALRKPEAGRDYTRKGLSGLGDGGSEKWFSDPRLDARFQLPDVFFTKDRKAFDKGHLVRREDVAWGRTYDILRRANGDSYHVTNCSPQVADFNQSAKGDGNWGDLENHVLSEAASERLCVFAGPVLKADDTVFHGVGDGGKPILARIPSSFWKVIVAAVGDGIAAFGFVLEQDLSKVQFEEFVPGDFAPEMHRLSDIAKMTKVVFAPELLAADQYDAFRGTELAQRTGIKRVP